MGANSQTAMAVAVENFQAELEKARETLKGVDENIRKITGRDPTEARNARLQSVNNTNTSNEGRENSFSRNRIPPRFHGRLASRDDHGDGPSPPKRIVRESVNGRPVPLVAVGNPKGWKHEDYEDGELPRKGAVHSSITAPHADKKTREDVLAQQSKDVKVKDRNRRMFGSLLGTLAKFRQEESHLKDKEDKRAKIEQRLDGNARQEKESLRKERHNLFLERRRQQAHVRRLEWKMHRLREHDEWAARQQPLLKFIQSTLNLLCITSRKCGPPKQRPFSSRAKKNLKKCWKLVVESWKKNSKGWKTGPMLAWNACESAATRWCPSTNKTKNSKSSKQKSKCTPSLWETTRTKISSILRWRTAAVP